MKSKSKRNKNKQVGLHQSKKFVHKNGIYQQNAKATYGLGENIYKSYLRGLKSKLHKDLTAQQQKQQKFWLKNKMGRRSE